MFLGYHQLNGNSAVHAYRVSVGTDTRNFNNDNPWRGKQKGGGVFEVYSGLTKMQIHLEICYKYSKLHCIHARGF